MDTTTEGIDMGDTGLDDIGRATSLREEREARVPHMAGCDDEGCYCPDDVFWGRLLGDKDPCAPGKDWASAAFGDIDEDDE